MSYKAIEYLAKQQADGKLGVWVQTKARLIVRIQLVVELTDDEQEKFRSSLDN